MCQRERDLERDFVLFAVRIVLAFTAVVVGMAFGAALLIRWWLG